MASIIAAWEIGDGHGHVRNLLATASILRAAGHQVVFVIPSAQITAIKLVESMGYAVERLLLPAHPSLSQYLPPAVNYRADSFLDVMGLHAFDSPDRLSPLLARYRIAIRDHKADLVLAESAPVAMLAARVENRLCLGIGTSFGIPETHAGVASYPQLDHFPNTPIFSDEKITASINAATHQQFENVGAALLCNRLIPFCYPAMDHYGEHRSLSHRGVGPVWQMNCTAPILELRGFAYLQSAYPAINELVSSIRKSGIPFTVYVRNGKFSSAGNMEVKAAFDVQEEMLRSSFVVHHGSAGFAQAALSAGIAQMCFPFHIENTNNAFRLQRLGVSKAIGYAQSRYFLSFLLENDDNRSNAAQVVAAGIESHAREFIGAKAAAAAVDDLL